MSSGSKRWIGFAFGLTLAQAVASASIPRGFALTTVSDCLFSLLLLALLLVFAGNAVRSQGRLRSVWILQAVGWAFWFADQACWFAFDVVLRKPLPEMFAGDAILFLAGVPMLAGLLLRPHLEPSHRSMRFGILDFLQLMLWWIYFYVYLVTCWQYVAKNAALYNRNFDWLYLTEILVLAGALALLASQSAGAWRRFYALFFGAAGFNYLTVLAENRAIEAHTYYNGSWYDTPFLASFALFMMVAMRGRNLRPAAETAKDEGYASALANLAVLAVLSLPVIVVGGAFDRSVPPEVARFRMLVTALTLFVMAALVLVKQRRLHQELKRANQVLEQASMTDPLTGIRNRRFFSATAETDVAQTLRAYAEGRDATARDLVFYLVDMDNFKEINDLYGHCAGDCVLIEAARRLESVVRDSDVLVRWGGEEFLIVSRFTDRREADALGLRILQTIRGEPFVINRSQRVSRTCSVGWAAFPWLEDNVGAMSHEEVLNLADRALSQAKRSGKDQAIGMTPALARAHSAANSRREADPKPPRPERREEPAGLQFSGLR
ncbi:MAG TPA: GGDEF domain-containing protein [Terracidiphilus sp.]|nr:GGDEF domain-containing protein [Terracidiphilus sp.]